MEVIPAIDIKDGKCVRLMQGEFDKEEVYSTDPLRMALYWQEQGAKLIHIVDLDGAREGRPQNMALIKKITNTLEIPLQLGGGIRSTDIIEEYLKSGVKRIILGTVAVSKPELVKKSVKSFGPDKIIVGVDARNGKAAVKGWFETSNLNVIDVIQMMRDIGVINFIYTDISRDGMLNGPDLNGIKSLIISDINLIASGGISSLEDLQNLRKLGINCAIVGKALYTGEIEVNFKNFIRI
jgi:phosphoribosylformimino-5-aminoimidazole carboxamide ribotide isomerase